MGFYATETPCLPRPEAGCDRPQETYLPPKNRVGGFSTSTPDRARRSAPQTLEPHRENAPTPTTTASGVRFYGFRFYSPEMGRWLNRDPIGERGGINLHRFVNNTPLNSYDPIGESSIGSGCSKSECHAMCSTVYAACNLGCAGLCAIACAATTFGWPICFVTCTSSCALGCTLAWSACHLACNACPCP